MAYRTKTPHKYEVLNAIERQGGLYIPKISKAIGYDFYRPITEAKENIKRGDFNFYKYQLNENQVPTSVLEVPVEARFQTIFYGADKDEDNGNYFGFELSECGTNTGWFFREQEAEVLLWVWVECYKPVKRNIDFRTERGKTRALCINFKDLKQDKDLIAKIQTCKYEYKYHKTGKDIRVEFINHNQGALQTLYSTVS